VVILAKKFIVIPLILFFKLLLHLRQLLSENVRVKLKKPNHSVTAPVSLEWRILPCLQTKICAKFAL
jgi:hypothetical protein